MTKLTEDQSNLIAAMYNTDDDETDKSTSGHSEKMLAAELNMSPGFITKIKMFGRTTLLPSIDYVKTLEKKTEEQAREIKRLKSSLTRVEHTSSKLVKAVNDLTNEMKNKIDRRDYR